LFSGSGFDEPEGAALIFERDKAARVEDGSADTDLADLGGGRRMAL